MLHTETVAPATLELLKRLMSNEKLEGFMLVGGTSLALQLGHRISVDLDLFCDTDFDENRLRESLERDYHLETDFIDRATVKGEIEGVKIDCIAHCYPWIGQPRVEEGIRLASLQDICAMKLNAIAGNGTRIKDFIDVAYLSSRFTLSQMLGFYEEKYHANALIPLKAIIFFDDVNTHEPVRMTNGKKLQWRTIQKRLIDMAKYPDRLFPNI